MDVSLNWQDFSKLISPSFPQTLDFISIFHNIHCLLVLLPHLLKHSFTSHSTISLSPSSFTTSSSLILLPLYTSSTSSFSLFCLHLLLGLPLLRCAMEEKPCRCWPCRAPLSWGCDDRKSARWHRAGLRHVTSSLERRGGRRRCGGMRKRRGGDMKWYISSSHSVSGTEAVIHHKSIFPCAFIGAVTLHLKRRCEHF